MYDAADARDVMDPKVSIHGGRVMNDNITYKQLE